MDDLQSRRNYIKYGLIIAVILCVLSGPFIFAKIQHRHSCTVYEDSLKSLRASGFPLSANEHISTSMQSRGSLDLTRQNQLFKLLSDAENWNVLSSHATYTIQKPMQLDTDQMTWFNESMHKADADKLNRLLNSGHLDKSMFAWLVQEYPIDTPYTFEQLLAAKIPSLMGTRNYSMYYEIDLIKNKNPDKILAWRKLQLSNDSLIGCMINIAALEHIDSALAYYVWRQGHPKMTLSITKTKDAYKQCLTGEALLFGQSFAKMLNENPWFDLSTHLFGVSDNPLDKAAIYMWGLLDCAASNNYYRNVFAALDNTLATEIKDIPIDSSTVIGSSTLPNLSETLRTLYKSNSHQRLCQISIYLSNYYHQHQTLPTDSSALKTKIPAAHALLAGDRFQFALKYTRPSESSYLLEVDSSHMPDSADMTRIRKIPSIGKHIFMLDDYFIFAEMNYPSEATESD